MTDENSKSEILLPILRKIPLFADLDENLHKEIIEHIIMMYYPIDYTIFKERDQGDALYIIKKGRVEIYNEPKEEGDMQKRIAEINQNGFFGEMALISDVPRSASAKTLEETEVFILSKDDFKKLLDTNKKLAEQVSATVVNRLNENIKSEQ